MAHLFCKIDDRKEENHKKYLKANFAPTDINFQLER
jgi:hypothetical protein